MEFLNKILSIFRGKQEGVEPEKNFVNRVYEKGYSFAGSSMSMCGDIRIGRDAMYEVHKTNKMAFAYKNKISQMVAKDGFYVVDNDGVEVDNAMAQKELETLYTFIGGQHMIDMFVSDFFDELFCSGQVFGTPTKINGLGQVGKEGKLKILDSRGMMIQTDKYGNPMTYTYQTPQGAEKYTPATLYDYIGYKDIDIKYQGISVYNTVVMDAITNYQASKQQMYFFKNNATPTTFIMLDPEAFKGTDGMLKKQEFDRKREEKYGGINNSGKSYSSHLVKDVKTLDISNVDLDLLNLRKENDSSFSVVFMLDSRLIGLWKSSGSYGEVESTTIRQGNEQIDSYGKMLGNFINGVYHKFVNPNSQYFFKAWNSEFKNLNEDKKTALLEVKNGVISGNEYRKKFGYEDL